MKMGFIHWLILVVGTVLGSFIAELTKSIKFLSWLSFGGSFGISKATPAVLDLGFLNVVFGLEIHITIATILGLILAIFICRKIR